MRKPSRKLVKNVIQGISGLCATVVAKSAIDNNTNPKGTLQEIANWIGASSIGLFVGAAAEKAVGNYVDLAFEAWDNGIAKTNELPEQQ